MKKTFLKLRAAYMDYPIWINPNDGSESYGIEISELDISSHLCNILKKWETDFHNTFVSDDPLSSGFKDYKQKLEHMQEGAKLADELQRELGNYYDVVYYPLR